MGVRQSTSHIARLGNLAIERPRLTLQQHTPGLQQQSKINSRVQRVQSSSSQAKENQNYILQQSHNYQGNQILDQDNKKYFNHGIPFKNGHNIPANLQ